jgi:hypothetical protein
MPRAILALVTAVWGRLAQRFLHPHWRRPFRDFGPQIPDRSSPHRPEFLISLGILLTYHEGHCNMHPRCGPIPGGPGGLGQLKLLD